MFGLERIFMSENQKVLADLKRQHEKADVSKDKVVRRQKAIDQAASKERAEAAAIRNSLKAARAAEAARLLAESREAAAKAAYLESLDDSADAREEAAKWLLSLKPQPEVEEYEEVLEETAEEAETTYLNSYEEEEV